MCLNITSRDEILRGYPFNGDLLATHTYTNGTDYTTETYAYDMLGNRIATTDALGNTTHRTYDPLGNLTAEWGATYPVRYTYDTQGRRTSLTTFRTTGAVALVATDGVTTTWTYDPATGNCLSKTYADNSIVTYTYTPDNLPLRETKPSGAWKENMYDAARQIVGVVSSDGAQDASMQRDEFGRVMAESNSVALAEYSLDDCWGATNETQTVDGVSVSFERGFDAYGRIERFDRIGGEESMFGYAPHGALSAVSNGNVAVEYAFTGDVLDAGYALAVQGGLDFSHEVFRHGYLRRCIVAVSNRCGNALQGLEYSYDALQRPVSRNSDSFDYNVRGEVVSATIDGRDESHSYDDIGNAVQASYPASTNDYTSNCRNQYSSIAAVAEGTQLVASVSYDLDGNMTRHGEWTYAYDSGNRLVSVASNGTTVATMSYDTQGRRVKKVAADGTHRYFYDGWLLVYEHVVRPNNTTNEVEYVWGRDVSGTRDGAAGIGGLLYQKRDGAIYVPWYDAYGNILGYRDAQGNVVASYTYDAFGNIINQSGTMADTFSFRFSTKYFDADCDLYYYGYRHYKPQIMCWLTEDPMGEGGGQNYYEFCANNPSCNVDFTGLWSHPLWPDKPDVTVSQIPQIMRANGMSVSAKLMERWLSTSATAVKGDDTTTVKMDWALTFTRAKVAYDEIFTSKLYATDKCKDVIRTKIRAINPSGNIRFCDLSRDVRAIYKDQVTYKVVGSSYRDPIDDMLGALGRFTFQVAVSADVKIKPYGYCAMIDEVGVFIRDQYDFSGIQPLGYWNPNTNYVGKNPYKGSLIENGTFQIYRSRTGLGGDFYIYSDVKRTKLKKNHYDKGAQMKRFIKLMLVCTFTMSLVLCALFFLRYGGATKRVLNNGYVVEVHRDNFYLFGFPGSGGDMQGFCKVYSQCKDVKPVYYYLEMVQFESEINETTIRIQDGRIVVVSPMIKTIGDNIWHLILF